MLDFVDVSLKAEKPDALYFSDRFDKAQKSFCLIIDITKDRHQIRKAAGYNCLKACRVGSIKDVFFCLDKNINFIINPFTYSTLYFDNSTIRIMKQNKVYPLVFMADYFQLNKGQKIGFLKNVFKLVKLAKKHSLPVFIASGAKNKDQIIYNNQFLYPLFGISLDQAKNFYDILFRK